MPGGGRELIPLTATDAQEWAESHLSAEDYEAEFGTQEEASPSDLTTREHVNLTLDSELMARLSKHSVDNCVPMARMIDKAITNILEEGSLSKCASCNDLEEKLQQNTRAQTISEDVRTS
ncbi:hypothetical protein JCM17380_17030 [Desulfosporosinus burensis]